jgi:hypothetical protein
MKNNTFEARLRVFIGGLVIGTFAGVLLACVYINNFII